MLKLCLVLLLSASVLSESVSPSEKVPELRGSASLKLPLAPEMAPVSAVNAAPQLGDVSSASVQRVPPLLDSVGLRTEPNDGSVG